MLPTRRQGILATVPAKRLALLAMVIIVLTAACGAASTSNADGTSANTAVHPFNEVQDSDFRFEADPADPTRGIFHVKTTEPMICAIVWGKDSSFGRFNNSLAMNGTGIVDHDVFLPDVEPGVTYHYIVQGTTADGTLYRSEESTFTIKRATGAGGGSASAGDNVATGANIVEASSAFSAAFAPERAVDGDLGTEWSSRGDGNGAFIVIDVGEAVTVNAVEFVTRSMADGSAITQAFTVSVDGAAPVGPFPASTPAERRSSPIDLTGQVFRFEVTASTGGNVGAVEIGLYRTTG